MPLPRPEAPSPGMLAGTLPLPWAPGADRPHPSHVPPVCCPLLSASLLPQPCPRGSAFWVPGSALHGLPSTCRWTPPRPPHMAPRPQPCYPSPFPSSHGATGHLPTRAHQPGALVHLGKAKPKMLPGSLVLLARPPSPCPHMSMGSQAPLSHSSLPFSQSAFPCVPACGLQGGAGPQPCGARGALRRWGTPSSRAPLGEQEGSAGGALR